MTTDELIENIRNWPELMRAHREGKEVQWLASIEGKWHLETSDPSAWSPAFRRRIKPEPRYTKGFDEPGNLGGPAVYRININGQTGGRILVYGDESLRNRILDFLNSEDA